MFVGSCMLLEIKTWFVEASRDGGVRFLGSFVCTGKCPRQPGPSSLHHPFSSVSKWASGQATLHWTAARLGRRQTEGTKCPSGVFIDVPKAAGQMPEPEAGGLLRSFGELWAVESMEWAGRSRRRPLETGSRSRLRGGRGSRLACPCSSLPFQSFALELLSLSVY